MSKPTDDLRALADLHGTGEPGDPWGHVERIAGEIDADFKRLRRTLIGALEALRMALNEWDNAAIDPQSGCGADQYEPADDGLDFRPLLARMIQETNHD